MRGRAPDQAKSNTTELFFLYLTSRCCMKISDSAIKFTRANSKRMRPYVKPDDCRRPASSPYRSALRQAGHVASQASLLLTEATRTVARNSTNKRVEFLRRMRELVNRANWSSICSPGERVSERPSDKRFPRAYTMDPQDVMGQH